MTDNGSSPPAPAAAPANEMSQPRRGLLGTAVDLAFATIGVLGVLGDEAQVLYERSLERGQDDVRRVKTLLREDRLGDLRRVLRGLPQRRPATNHAGQARERSTTAPDPDEWRLLLARLNLPTATDVHVLTEQVAELEVQIERLLSARQPGVKP